MPEPTREAPRDHNWREEDFGAVISGRYGADDIHISHSADNELRFEVGGWGWFVNALDLIEAVWHVADDTLRESGWRPPPRWLMTPAEFDPLPGGSVVKGEWLVYQKNMAGSWITPGEDGEANHWTAVEMFAREGGSPFLLLHDPTETARTGE